MGIVEQVREFLPEKYRELAKFLVVGGASWIVDTSLFLLLSHTVLDGKVLTSKIVSVLVATIFNYVLNREWSFRDRGGREAHHEAMLFFVTNAIALGLTLLPLWLSHYPFRFNEDHFSRFTVSVTDFIAANIVGTAVGMAFRYWAYRRFVFPEELAHAEGSAEDDQAAELPTGR